MGDAVIATLRVRQLATIDELDLELGPGLNVLTGETGAGKSVLLSAVALLCGRRVSSEVVRTGAASGRVEAIVESPQLLDRARELGLAEADDEELLVSRSISREGRGKVFVNGKLATVSLLAQLLGDSIEVTSQGEHQRLLRPEVQADLVDAYGDLEPRVREVAALHRRWRGLAAEIHHRRAHASERARREDQLRFEIDQIDAAALSPGEAEALGTERDRLAHVGRLSEMASSATAGLDGGDGVRDRVGVLRAEIEAGERLDGGLVDVREALERAGVELDEAAHLLAHYAASLEGDPARLDAVEARLDEIHRLCSRYGDDVEQILAHRARAQTELEKVGGGEARTAELEREQAEVAAELGSVAAALSSARAAVGEAISERVAEELAAVDLPRAAFSVAFERVSTKTVEGWDAPSGPGGRERPRFELTANPGEAARRLRDAASGGELSRLLLALRNVLRDAEAGSVLLFDEIDAGVGGRTAGRVGGRLRSLARRHQILCITHLPQVAAAGDAHFRVAKRTRSGRTHTRVERLTAEDRVEEIARMAGGARVTDAARTHARELLERR